MAMVDTFLDSKTGTGRDLEKMNLLRHAQIGEILVVNSFDQQLCAGTTALVDCASLGIWSPELAGVNHVSFLGADPVRWYERFTESADKLMALGHEKGGEQFVLFFVNVRTGYRRVQENLTLGKHAEEWVQKRIQDHGDVTSYDWYNGSGYYINKHTGVIYPY